MCDEITVVEGHLATFNEAKNLEDMTSVVTVMMRHLVLLRLRTPIPGKGVDSFATDAGPYNNAKLVTKTLQCGLIPLVCLVAQRPIRKGEEIFVSH